MPLSISLRRNSPHIPPAIPISLSTPLYLLTTLVSVSAIVLLVFSGDGFPSRPYDSSPFDGFIIDFPLNTLLVSALTAPVLCFFWMVGLWIRVRWVRRRKTGGAGEVGKGSKRLSGDEKGQGDHDDAKGWKYNRGPVGKVLLSWNAWLALTLTASLAVLIWRYVVNARGRTLRDEAVCAAVLLAADCVLHAWLAVPGLGDIEVTVLKNPFNKGEERWSVDGWGKGESGQGDDSPSAGDQRAVKEAEQKAIG